MDPTRKTALETHRNEARLSREQLAARAGITSKTIFNIERGQVKPNGATLQVLAMALGCDLADLKDEPDEVAA